jgi:hypothetical protein
MPRRRSPDGAPTAAQRRGGTTLTPTSGNPPSGGEEGTEPGLRNLPGQLRKRYTRQLQPPWHYHRKPCVLRPPAESAEPSTAALERCSGCTDFLIERRKRLRIGDRRGAGHPRSGLFYCLLPWDVAGCESPERVCAKDHLRRRNRRSHARIHRPTRPTSVTRDQLSERFPSLSTTTTVVPSSACKDS